MKPRKHPAKDARITAKIYAAEVDQMKRAFGRLLHPDTPASTSVGGCAMTPDQIDLARRLVACRRWRWLPGMAYMRRGRPHRVDPEVLSAGGSYDDTCLPDLIDPATAGCLLAMLVAADPGAGWGVSCGPDVGWRATSCDHDLPGATCGEAVARALLVAWGAL